MRKLGAYTWRRNADGTNLQKALDYPTVEPPVDNHIVERWNFQEVTKSWVPDALTIVNSPPQALSEWAVNRIAGLHDLLTSTIYLPDFVGSIGLPTSIFFTVYLGTPSEVFDSGASWSLTVDTSKVFEQVVFSPLQQKVDVRGAYYSGWIRGIVKALSLPNITFELSAWFQDGKYTNGYDGILSSEVLASLPTIEIDTDDEGERVVSDGWTVL